MQFAGTDIFTPAGVSSYVGGNITDMLHCSYSSEEARNDVPLDWELVGPRRSEGMGSDAGEVIAIGREVRLACCHPHCIEDVSGDDMGVVSEKTEGRVRR